MYLNTFQLNLSWIGYFNFSVKPKSYFHSFNSRNFSKNCNLKQDNSLYYAGYYGWFPPIRFISILIQLLKYYYYIHHQNRSGLDLEYCRPKRTDSVPFLYASENWNSSISNWRSPDLDRIDSDKFDKMRKWI